MVSERCRQWGGAFYASELDNGCYFSNHGAQFDFLDPDSFRAGQHGHVVGLGACDMHGDCGPASGLIPFPREQL